MRAECACKQAAGDRRRVDFAVHFDDEVADGEFSQFAVFVEEENIVAVEEIFSSGVVHVAVGGFVEEEYIV